jgi:hypothetical protein
VGQRRGRGAVANKALQNRCAASHTKAVRKVGELTQRMRKEGVLAKQGRPKKITAGDDSEKTSRDVMFLSDLDINPNIAAAGVKLLALTPDEIDAKEEAGRWFSSVAPARAGPHRLRRWKNFHLQGRRPRT